MPSINVSLPYKPLYDADKHYIICDSGRISGKSFEISRLASLWLARYPQDDVMYCRATAESIGDSIYNELCEKVDEINLWHKDTKKPYHITTAYGNEVHFKGLDGNTNRTKGNKPKRKYSLIIIDECEEIRSEINLEQALASFKRHLDMSVDWKIIFAGNPAEQRSHWWNVWVEKHSKTDRYTLIKSTYRDIIKILPPEVVEDIELNFVINPQLARFMYLGDITDLAGGAYPSFRREKHLITPSESMKIFGGEIIQAVIFGGDGAIMNDATCLSPIAVMTSGRCAVLERFIYDPIQKGRPLAPIEYAEQIKNYLDWMNRKYQLKANGTPCYIIVDAAAADLVMQLNYTLDNYYQVNSFSDKHVIQNTAVVNNAFARNMCYVIDYGGYMDWSLYNGKDAPLIPTDPDVLCEQLENVVWKNNKLDPSVRNDCSDSLVYGLQYYALPDKYEIFLPTKEKTYV